MLTEAEIAALKQKVQNSEYTVEDALADIAEAQKGEDVRAAMYAGIFAGYNDGKVGSTDLIARQAVEDEESAREAADSKIETDYKAADTSLENILNDLFPNRSLSGPAIRRVSEVCPPNGYISGEYDGGVDDIWINADGAVTMNYRHLYVNQTWAENYRPIAVNVFKSGKLNTRLNVGLGIKTETDDDLGEYPIAEWDGTVTVYNPTNAAVNLYFYGIEIFFIRKDLVN